MDNCVDVTVVRNHYVLIPTASTDREAPHVVRVYLADDFDPDLDIVGLDLWAWVFSSSGCTSFYWCLILRFTGLGLVE